MCSNPFKNGGIFFILHVNSDLFFKSERSKYNNYRLALPSGKLVCFHCSIFSQNLTSVSQISFYILMISNCSFIPLKIRPVLSEVSPEISCLTQLQSQLGSLWRFFAWETISLSNICMTECTPTDWFCLQANMFHALPLCVMSSWVSLKLFSPVIRRACNPTRTLGMMNKHNFLLFQFRDNARRRNLGLTGWHFCVCAVFCLAISLLISYRGEDKLNFDRLNCEKKKKTHFNTELQWCSWHHFGWKQIGFIRTRHMRIYVVIQAEVKIFSTAAAWFNIDRHAWTSDRCEELSLPWIFEKLHTGHRKSYIKRTR